MAMVLLLLMLHVVLDVNTLLLVAIVLQVVTMTIPVIFKPVAVIWLGAADVLGNIASKAMMMAVFFALVTPIGLLRRLMGADSMKLGAFKDAGGSVMVERNHKFTASDVTRPY